MQCLGAKQRKVRSPALSLPPPAQVAGVVSIIFGVAISKANGDWFQVRLQQRARSMVCNNVYVTVLLTALLSAWLRVSPFWLP